MHKNFIMKTVLLKPAMPHTTRVEEESWLGIHFLHSRLFIASYFLKRGRRKKEHGRGRRGISYMPGRKKSFRLKGRKGVESDGMPWNAPYCSSLPSY